MAPSLNYALSSPPYVAFLVFTALAIGLALPYVLLSFQPALLEKLPRPGPWMETFKQFMAFPMLGAAVWLLGVFGAILGMSALIWVLQGLVVLALGLWVYGRFHLPHLPKKTRTLAKVGTLLLFGAFLTLATIGYHKGIASRDALADTPSEGTILKYGLEWEPIDAVKIVQNRKAGRATFIDFTADW